MKHESKLRFTDEEQSDDENAGVESAETADAGMRQMAARSRKARQRRNTKGAERPRLSGNPFSRWQQKRAIQKRYTAARRRTQAAEETARAAKRTARTANRVTGSIVRHRRGILIAAILFLLVALIGGTVSSCAAMLQGGLASVAGSTYPCADADMLGAEAAYSAKEAELQAYLDSYERTHGYDEYVYALDEIKHDPYVLISFLTAYHIGGWTLADAEPTLDLLFGRQYTLTESVTTETRYHGDGEPYTVTICTVTLENFDLSHLPVYLLSEEQLAMYAGYMKTLGNRPDLFPADAYPYASRRTDYLR
ncbi:MAG: peptidase M23, partial [Oscillospiraceae bacterium]|nr:peptidase M23 [Oscillospiraceae bacterium]